MTVSSPVTRRDGWSGPPTEVSPEASAKIDSVTRSPSTNHCTSTRRTLSVGLNTVMTRLSASGSSPMSIALYTESSPNSVLTPSLGS